MADISVITNVDRNSPVRTYGIPMRDYTVDGAEHCGFIEAIAFGALRQSYAIEALSTAVSRVVKLRQKKASEIGDALATVSEAVTSMPMDDQDVDKESNIDVSKLKAANEIFKRYGIGEMELAESGQVTYGTASYKQTDVQLALDRENNDLQQNMNSLQNLVTKRDNAFQVASKVVAKATATASDTIRAIGA